MEHNENQTSVDLNTPLLVKCWGWYQHIASHYCEQITHARLTYDERTQTIEFEYLRESPKPPTASGWRVVHNELIDLYHDAEVLALVGDGVWNISEVELLVGSGIAYFFEEGAQS